MSAPTDESPAVGGAIRVLKRVERVLQLNQCSVHGRSPVDDGVGQYVGNAPKQVIQAAPARARKRTFVQQFAA